MMACVPGFDIIGSVALRIISSDTKISASPIRMRPIWRVLLPSPRKKTTTPTISSSGIRMGCRTIKSCVTRAEPTSAPSKIARPVAVTTPPLEIKLDTRTATAVALCSKTAAPIPVPAASNLFLAEWRSQMRMGAAKPRSTPVRTNRTAQISRAAAPAICIIIWSTCGSFTGFAFFHVRRLEGKRTRSGLWSDAD